MVTINKRLAIILAAIPLLLLIPLIAMQFTSEVQWSLFDFVIMGVLLLGTGLAIEAVLRMVKNSLHRLVLTAAIILALLLIWAEMAVGIFGTPIAGS